MKQVFHLCSVVVLLIFFQHYMLVGYFVVAQDTDQTEQENVYLGEVEVEVANDIHSDTDNEYSATEVQTREEGGDSTENEINLEEKELKKKEIVEEVSKSQFTGKQVEDEEEQVTDKKKESLNVPEQQDLVAEDTTNSGSINSGNSLLTTGTGITTQTYIPDSDTGNNQDYGYQMIEGTGSVGVTGDEIATSTQVINELLSIPKETNPQDTTLKQVTIYERPDEQTLYFESDIVLQNIVITKKVTTVNKDGKSPTRTYKGNKISKGYIFSGTSVKSAIVGNISIDNLVLEEVLEQPNTFTSELLGGVSLGPKEDHLIFSKPVQLNIAVDSKLNGQEIAIYAFHVGDDKFGIKGLTVNANALCDTEGEVLNGEGNNVVTVKQGYASIYTCSASVFTVTYIGGANVDNFIDNGTKDKTISVTTADTAAGTTIQDMQVVVHFQKIDSEDPTSFATNNVYSSEISMSLTHPNAVTSIDLIVDNTYTNDTYAGAVTVTFDDTAGSSPSNLPITGTFLPTDALSTFDGLTPLGDWIFTFADSANQDGLILYSIDLVFTDNATCGNSILEGGEGCDDGGTSTGDGCNEVCLIETSFACNTTSSGVALSNSCASSVCDSNETTPTCESANTCGNGLTESGEQCDDGNTTNSDGCDSTCQIEFCGDGIVNPVTTAGVVIYSEDFENIGNGTINGLTGTIYTSGSYSIFFESTDTVGRARYGTTSVQQNGGGGALTMDVDTNNNLEIQYTIFQIDMTPYTGVQDLELAFDYSQHGEESHTNDRVRIRGSNTGSRIEVYDRYTNRAGNGTYRSVSGIEIDSSLASNNQSLSVTFQIRFGQEDNFSANNTNANDGISIDNIQILGTVLGPSIAEECDDANTSDGDGCDASCNFETGYLCTGEPSVCAFCDGTEILIGFTVRGVDENTEFIPFDIFTSESFRETPIVLATPQTQNNNDNSSIPVISNITTTGFNISLCVDDGNTTCASAPSPEDIGIIVIDKHKAGCSNSIDIGTTTIATDGTDTAFSFSTGFSNTPYVFTTPQTANQGGNIAAHARVDDGTLTTAGGDFVGCVHQGTANTCTAGQPNETLGRIAIDPVLYAQTGVLYGSQSISNSTWTAVSFSPSYTTAPVIMVTQNSDNGAQDAQYALARNVTTIGADIRYCEQDGANTCDGHIAETVNRISVTPEPPQNHQLQACSIIALDKDKVQIGTDETAFATVNLEAIEYSNFSYTIQQYDAFTGTSSFNFTADGLNACSVGNKQNSMCNLYDNNTWISYISGQNTATFKDQGNLGDYIRCTYTSSLGDSKRTYDCIVDEHYNPNIFKRYSADFDFTDVKRQTGANERISNNNPIRVELQSDFIPTTGDQYKLDFRVQITGSPTQPLEAYMCNDMYTSGDPAVTSGCIFIAQKFPIELTTEKFRGIFTYDSISSIGGNNKYVVITTDETSPSAYYSIKTYAAQATGWTQKRSYSNDNGSTWNTNGDGYESELNINWFSAGFDNTTIVYDVLVEGSSLGECSLTRDIDATFDYPPLVDLVLPPANETLSGDIEIKWIVSEINDEDYLVDITASNGIETVIIGTGLTSGTTSIIRSSTGVNDGYRDITVQACEVPGKGEEKCGSDAHTITLLNGNDFGEVCIEAPSSYNFSGAIESQEFTQTLTEQFSGYFSVLDSAGNLSGYYTTLSISNFTGQTYSGVITNDLVEWYSSGITLLSGNSNTGVVLPTLRSSFYTATGTYTFIKRDAGINQDIIGVYGTKPRIHLTIPPYTKPDTYQATITYTLYE